MSPNTPIDADEVHVVDAAAARGSRAGFFVVVVLLLAVAGAGAWVVMEQPFADEAQAQAPPPASDNLLGQGWSFESGEHGAAQDFWRPDEGAPVGFQFGADGAVSGSAAAVARPGDDGWAGMVSKTSWRLPGRGGQVALSGVSAADGVQLVLRFLATGRPDLDAVVASGRGALAGRVSVPPGYEQVAVVVVCVGSGSVDDLSLTFVEEPGATAQAIGVYEVLAGDPPGLSVLRGSDLVLRVDPPSVRPAEGRFLPGRLAVRPGTDTLLMADGETVGYRSEVSAQGSSLAVTTSLTGAPSGARLVHAAFLGGSLAQAAVGVRSPRGYDRYTSDIEVSGIDELILGHTQDRLVLSADSSFDLAVTHRPDGTIALMLSRPLAGSLDSVWTVKGSFQQERLKAAQLREEARLAEQAGQLGAALVTLNEILTKYPYDEQVAQDAGAARSRLELDMQAKLVRLGADLEDARFLGSAQRCKEVRAEALLLASVYAGSPAAAQFSEMATRVETEAASLLAEEARARRGRVEALLDSFREHGGYPSMVAEFEEYLARHLEPGDDA